MKFTEFHRQYFIPKKKATDNYSFIIEMKLILMRHWDMLTLKKDFNFA